MSQALLHRDADLGPVRQRLRAMVGKACPPPLRGQEDDLTQLAMVKALRLLEREPERQLNATYLRRLVHSVVVDALRKHHRSRDTVTEPQVMERVAAPGPAQPEQQAYASQIRQAVQDCMSSVRHTRRDALLLYLLGHTVPQAAQRLAISAKKAENYVYRGLSELRRCLSTKGVHP